MAGQERLMSNSSSARSDKVCVVVGVGEGLGAALAKRFAVGYPVALIARSGEVIGKIGAEIKAAGGAAVPIQSDATVESQIASAHEQISRELGAIEILIFNGGRRPMGRLMETTPEVFEQTWRLHAFGAFLWARQVVPRMLARGRGTILITGATAGVRPWPTSAAFAPAKFAVRGLAQVMARDLHPQGIHVAYVNVDGGIDMPLLRKFRPDAPDSDFLKPPAIADAFWYLAHQDPSAWSHELDIRPFKEKF
jgi:NAD(P)-dependent dehydrogenase (short-subunit alcohol dehydrogenase family)